MNKTRLEFLSDGVFAIVFTLLAIEIRVPEHAGSYAELMHGLSDLTPVFLSYFMSFAILTMFWLSHHGLYQYFTKTINRQLVLLNMVYLSFIALVPFSTHLLGEYGTYPIAIAFYGLNILCISLIAVWVFYYAIWSKEVDLHEFSSRVFKQAKIRLWLTPTFNVLGLIFVAISLPLALFFFAFPIFFNVIPGTLDATEKLFGLKIE